MDTRSPAAEAPVALMKHAAVSLELSESSDPEPGTGGDEGADKISHGKGLGTPVGADDKGASPPDGEVFINDTPHLP